MKLRNSGLIVAFFLLLGAAVAGAATSADLATAPIDIPSVESVVSAPPDSSADCGSSSVSSFANALQSSESDLPGMAPASAGLTGDVCGNCSLDPCKGMSVNAICGFDSTLHKNKVCQDYLGLTCGGANPGGAKCRCSAAPIP